MKKEAMLYQPIKENNVLCFLCHHRCEISPYKYGICGVRQNENGKLFTHAYGNLIAMNVDPIEKKPLYHFLPGTQSFSIATMGCNFQCPFCQNWQISQIPKNGEISASGKYYSPEEIVSAAERYNCQSIAYTYTEPTIFFEYAYDTATLAKKKGIANVFVTNGYMTREALEMIRSCLDACNVDLKAFSESFYKKTCKAKLMPVLESIRSMKELGIWVEVTTLVIPGVNDSKEELNQIARFVASVDPGIPWHISRFHPDYKYTNIMPTPVEILRLAYSIGRKAGLKYIYIGNVTGESEDTLCPQCHRILIQRKGYVIREYNLKEGKCQFCGAPIGGIFRMAD